MVEVNGRLWPLMEGPVLANPERLLKPPVAGTQTLHSYDYEERGQPVGVRDRLGFLRVAWPVGTDSFSASGSFLQSVTSEFPWKLEIVDEWWMDGLFLVLRIGFRPTRAIIMPDYIYTDPHTMRQNWALYQHPRLIEI